MDVIKVKVKNHSYLEVGCEPGIGYELNEHFSFYVDGYKHSPKFKMRIWDGRISLFNLTSKTLPIGLYKNLVEFAKTRDYQIELVESPFGMPLEQHNILPEDVVEYIKGLNVTSDGKQVDARDYQLQAIYLGLKYKRKVLISSTGSGKSLVIYGITRYIQDNFNGHVLIVVPTKALVFQMFKDFEDYASTTDFDVEENTHIIMGGIEKNTNKPIVISTWQSLMRLPSNHKLFSNCAAIICDEAHLCKGQELSKITGQCVNASYKLGLTGSLDKSKTNQLQIQGLLGPITRVSSTKDLIEQGHLSDMQIKCLTFDYKKETKAMVSQFKDYHLEIDFIVSHERRNKFIRNLALSLDGNTLVLYTLVEKHGNVLDKLFKEKIGDRKYFYIHGGVDGEERDAMRPIVESNNNAIILASYGTLSTGVNLKRLHNIILASPTKSVVRVLQSIGRGLRKGEGKDGLTVYDLSDNLSNKKSKKNFTYNHFVERLSIYLNESFDYSIVELPIEV